MPLTELVRMFKGKVEVSQEGASIFTDPSSRPDSDCVELVWENGQIMTQGKARKSSNSNNFQTLGPRPQDSKTANCSKVTKFSTMETVMADFPMSVPSCDMELDRDIDLVPWLSYPMEEPLHNDYASDFLHELSGITINDLPTQNQLGYHERKGSFQGDSGHDSSVTLKHGITPKVSSSNEKDNRGESSEAPQILFPFQHNVPRSGTSDINGNNSGNAQHVSSRDSAINTSSLNAFTSLRLQKLDAGAGHTSTSSGFNKFPYFSRPAALLRASHVTVSPSKKLQNPEKRCTLSGSNPANSTLVNLDSGCSQKEMVSNNQSIVAPEIGNPEALPTKPIEEPFSAKQSILREDIAKNYGSQIQACETPMSKVGASGDRNMEPVIATSSVCSANSAERVSDEPARNLKRKSRETAESSGPSEEVEEESAGAKKPASARVGSKRSRAAEVHNLSERRRRDRINEKMRALQELIPNCNKADKASMLDEAIEYLKTLQLQVQILSMGAGMYTQPMMLPPGMQPIHGAHMPHFAPLGLGMGMGMGFGMNMFNMNNFVKMVPFQGPHYPVPGTGPSFPGMPGSNLQALPHPGQGLPMSMQQAPVVPAPMSAGMLKMPMSLNASHVAGTSNAPHLALPSDTEDSNPQAIPSTATSNYLNQATNQARASNEGIQPTSLCSDQPQGINPSEKSTVSANGKDVMLT